MRYENDGDFTTGTARVGTDRETGLADAAIGPRGDGAGARAERVKERAREAAEKVTHRAADTIEERAERQKGRATNQLEDLARSLRVASENMPADNGISRYMGMAAGQVDNLASFLGNNDVADLVDDVEDFARRQPALFIGGAFAVGMLGARFLKSSRRDLEEDRFDRWESRGRTTRPVEERDAVSRPGAPGYAAPTDERFGTERF